MSSKFEHIDQFRRLTIGAADGPLRHPTRFRFGCPLVTGTVRFSAVGRAPESNDWFARRTRCQAFTWFASWAERAAARVCLFATLGLSAFSSDPACAVLVYGSAFVLAHLVLTSRATGTCAAS
jgi:hypothetical protein